jgi:hypothetical protein
VKVKEEKVEDDELVISYQGPSTSGSSAGSVDWSPLVQILERSGFALTLRGRGHPRGRGQRRDRDRAGPRGGGGWRGRSSHGRGGGRGGGGWGRGGRSRWNDPW